MSRQGAEIEVTAGAAFAPALAELGPQFERSTGHRLAIQYAIADAINRMIDGDAAFDLLIASADLLDKATKLGRIAADTRAEIARVGMAVAARMGAGKPEIGSVETFKRALINAKSITYPPQGTVGIHLAKVFDRLGIAEQMKAKTRPQQTVAGVPRSVAAGEAELGFTPCTALISIEGVNVLGPFPPELQHDIVYTAAVGAAARQPDAAKALITFLTTPHAAIVMAANGFQGVR